MLVQIREALSASELRAVRQRLDAAGDAWVDGRVTAGSQGAAVKRNQQIAEGSPIARELGDIVLGALERNATFISATLPSRAYPPMFNRYEGGMHFGDHIDNAVRLLPGSADKIRTDVSITVFLSAPADYDGGELIVEDTFGTHTVKLPAGDAIVYPASSLHRVAPVTRGTRLASFFWVQSLVRDDAQRALLFELDRATQAAGAGETASAHVKLAGIYHNLLRFWSQP